MLIMEGAVSHCLVGKYFIDKQHVRNVVRHYAIELGFEVLVERANDKIYIVRSTWTLIAVKGFMLIDFLMS